MTQYQYDTIIKLIMNGAPALSDDLCFSFAELVNERNKFKDELDKLKSNEEEK